MFVREKGWKFRKKYLNLLEKKIMESVELHIQFIGRLPWTIEKSAGKNKWSPESYLLNSESSESSREMGRSLKKVIRNK